MADARPQRDHAQVLPSSAMAPVAPTNNLEFAETTAVTLEWKLSGLKAMYEASKGETKSKCVKSAVFGDADNLWEVLWYPNSGVQGGEYASLYLSCVEREANVGGTWTRKGIWWFRFEVKSFDERSNKSVTIASKDATDHTFALRTANWGWQSFSRRDTLFLAPTVLASDACTIVCTIQAQPQPPAGFWLGVGLAPSSTISSNTTIGGKNVGSGGGLSAWAGGDGACGGVAGGTTAGGGVKRVVPRELVSAVGSMLDDQLYSDVEFVIPSRRKDGTAPHRIYASKKLLQRCDYFEAMFSGGFMEEDGVLNFDDPDEDDFDLSDSDQEDESSPERASVHGTTRDVSPASARRLSMAADAHDYKSEELDDGGAGAVTKATAEGPSGEGHAEEQPEEIVDEVVRKKGPLSPRPQTSDVVGPKKTKVVVRDAAWSTWWAVLYWLYTDTIYFAPLSSSFNSDSIRRHSRTPSSSSAVAAEARSRQEWISLWLNERGISEDEHGGGQLGPRPVSAKAVYRLADKLDLPALKLRAFQHICGQLTSANIPAEVFSRFSSTFEDVRKVQVAFFLKHWTDIKKSDTMQNIWKQIRDGKHVGFEEVWPLIVNQLDFRPS